MLTLIIAVLAAAIGWWAWENAHRKTHPVSEGHQPSIEIPHESEFELYHNPLSLCSMKTRVCMAELGIPYVSHPIDLIETGSYENIGRAFLKINPGGTVPVLVHNGHPIYESHCQIRYAADHAPAGNPSLVPEDPTARAEMQRWIDRSSITDDPLNHGDESAGNAIPGLTLPLFAAMIDRIAYWKIFEGLLFHLDKRRPVVFSVLKMRGLDNLASIPPVAKFLGRSQRQIRTHLAALESQLLESGGPWILGEFFSLADVSWLVIFERIAQVDCLEVLVAKDHLPQCYAYWVRLRERPSYREAILEHSHPTIKHGTQRLHDAKAADPALRIFLEGDEYPPVRPAGP